MATPSEKLADSLNELKKLQNTRGIAIVKSDKLSRIHKKRLQDNGFIQEVIKGWYISKHPDELEGDSTSWYSSFWIFILAYIDTKFGDNWSLSPEQSLSLHSGNFTVPKQLLIRSPRASNHRIDLIFNTSIFDSRLEIPDKEKRTTINGLQLYSLAMGLVSVGSNFFISHPVDARTCLASFKDASEILALLLEEGKTVVAGRLAGAFRNIGNHKIADEIIDIMKSAGYDVREADPFKIKLDFAFSLRETSLYANRIKTMWYQMRNVVIDNFNIENFPLAPMKSYIDNIDRSYTYDAYHSLSIEGYQVTPELIERIRIGRWNPAKNPHDKEEKDALAARGYFKSFKAVKKSIQKILQGKNAGDILRQNHSTWYRELFAPSITAGILRPSDLAGYRNGQVFIKGSQHTPPDYESVRDAMPVFFDLLESEDNGGVRIILGHFIFVYIHPYFDGNGRIARFIMNAMAASTKFPWIVIPVERRKEYMSTLEQASVYNDIIGFTKFIISVMKDGRFE